MGQTLSEPITTKESAFCQNNDYRVGSSCMQGWRINMEDSHTHILSLPDDPNASFFAVFDGHGGAKVAQFAGKNLHTYLTNRPEYKEGQLKLALKKAFLDIDKDMRDEESLKEEQGGSTAIVVLIKDNRLYCANAGDSRAIASVDGNVQPLSRDHKPTNREESKRILEAGGWVEYNRVNGNLALSRALGDFAFKQNTKKSAKDQVVTAYPDVREFNISEDWEFLVIACDGIWDVLSNSEVLTFVRERIGKGLDPTEICEELMMQCLSPDCEMAGLGCDNMTVVIICFLHGQPYTTLVEKCKMQKEKLIVNEIQDDYVDDDDPELFNGDGLN